ncbi:MAG TPA: class I SAM-dependent methyltransferase [Blastocatellia bacterium]|nr:class I SAM-dependent methyltransferase [Blastocatellia bacterium]
MAFDTKTTWDACGAAFDRYTSTEDSYSENVERPVIESLLGDLRQASALDLGCGSATYATRLAARGARVVGVDLSATMLKLARARARTNGVELELMAADISKPLPLADAQFDLVFTATALHYVEDLQSVMREIARVLQPHGRLLASVLHPMSTSRFPVRDHNDASSDEWATRARWPAHYFAAAPRCVETPWLAFGEVSDEGRRLDCFHHTVSDYFAALEAAGLQWTHLREPAPPASFAAKNPERYEEAMSLPLYLIFAARK